MRTEQQELGSADRVKTYRLHDVRFLQRPDIASATMEVGPIAPLLAAVILDINAVWGRRGKLSSLESAARYLRCQLAGAGLEFALDDIARALESLDRSGFIRLARDGCIELDGPESAGGAFASKARERDGFVYVIENPESGLLKIGTSIDPDRRLSELRTQIRADLSIVGKFAGSYRAESKAHRRFAELRVHGEWFQDDPAIRDWVASKAGAN